MFVIIKHLHSSITMDELEKIVVPAAKGRFFQKQGFIKSLKIVELVTRKGSPVERHGIVRVDSDATKKRLIKSLNGRPINNVRHAVGEYVIRHWSIDRRSDGLPSTSFLMKTRTVDRRMCDRRRSGLRMVEISQKPYSIQSAQAVLASTV